MASTIIHIAVAKKINEKFGKEEVPYFLGSIAPDIVKMVGIERNKSHFITPDNPELPNIDLFLKKYKNNLSTPYELGYLVHLLTDKL